MPSAVVSPVLELTATARGFFGSAADGDFRIDRADLAARRAAVASGTWHGLTQVHGTAVVDADTDAADPATASTGDALVSARPATVLSVLTADCAPLLIVTPDAGVAAVHAGWRGLLGGVLDAAVVALAAGAGTRAWLGPCIHACCYEFGPGDRRALVRRFGPGVAGCTREGRPALDLVAAVTGALAGWGVAVDTSHSRCTACTVEEGRPVFYSHRARRDTARQVSAVWLDEGSAVVTGAP